jgi:hypothetical protein
MDMDTFQDEYDMLYEKLELTNKTLDELQKEYNSLTSFIRKNILYGVLNGMRIVKLSIDSIKHGIVKYTYVASFGNELDDPHTCRIPLKYCDSIRNVCKYYEYRGRRIAEIRNILENRKRREEATQAEIEAEERAMYEKLKQKFEPNPKEI